MNVTLYNFLMPVTLLVATILAKPPHSHVMNAVNVGAPGGQDLLHDPMNRVNNKWKESKRILLRVVVTSQAVGSADLIVASPNAALFIDYDVGKGYISVREASPLGMSFSDNTKGRRNASSEVEPAQLLGALGILLKSTQLSDVCDMLTGIDRSEWSKPAGATSNPELSELGMTHKGEVVTRSAPGGPIAIVINPKENLVTYISFKRQIHLAQRVLHLVTTFEVTYLMVL